MPTRTERPCVIQAIAQLPMGVGKSVNCGTMTAVWRSISPGGRRCIKGDNGMADHDERNAPNPDTPDSDRPSSDVLHGAQRDLSRRDFVTLSVAAGLAAAAGPAAAADMAVTETMVTVKTPDGLCDC